jgi:mRNA-degrading endonuclease RelE of RelBE toxin-antitoxin system
MKVHYGPRALELLKDSPVAVQRAFFKQVRLLSENLRHPSLRAKKFDEAHGIWQGRVNRNWRFYFMIKDDTYVILDVIPHPK